MNRVGDLKARRGISGKFWTTQISLFVEQHAIEVASRLRDAYEVRCQQQLEKRIGTFPIIGDSDSGWAVSGFCREVN